MRLIATILIIILAGLGFVAGLVISPFVVGYLAAQEVVANFADEVIEERERRQQQEGAE